MVPTTPKAPYFKSGKKKPARSSFFQKLTNKSRQRKLKPDLVFTKLSFSTTDAKEHKAVQSCAKDLT